MYKMHIVLILQLWNKNETCVQSNRWKCMLYPISTHANINAKLAQMLSG